MLTRASSGADLSGRKSWKTWVSSILERWAKAAALTKETFGATSMVGGNGVSEEIGARATVSGDVKESVCNREWNVILPNTQSINRLKWVSQSCPNTVAQLESNRVT